MYTLSPNCSLVITYTFPDKSKTLQGVLLIYHQTIPTGFEPATSCTKAGRLPDCPTAVLDDEFGCGGGIRTPRPPGYEPDEIDQTSPPRNCLAPTHGIKPHPLPDNGRVLTLYYIGIVLFLFGSYIEPHFTTFVLC